MTFKQLLYISFGLTILNACQTDVKRHDFGKFSIELPTTWKTNHVQGIDSFVKEFVTDSGDTLSFDLGYYSNTLEEPLPILFPKSYKEFLLKETKDISGIIFLDSIDPETYKKYLIQIRTDTVIDGFKAYLVKPKQTGEGITGVYFDSIGNGPIGNIRLNFYGRDLNEKEQSRLLSAIETIRIKR